MSNGLKALEVLKAQKAVYEVDLQNRIDNSYNIQYEDDNEITKAILNQLNFIDEAIKELEEYEQNFKQKEFDYRTECQELLSEGRVEAENMPDRLAELEKVILYYYLDKGYQVGVGHWSFNVEIDSLYKSKTLKVKFVDYEKEIDSFECKIEVTTTKEMFDKAIAHFTHNENEVIKCNQGK